LLPISFLGVPSRTKTVNAWYDWPESIGDERKLSDIDYIVIHHTATRDDLTAKQMKLSMERTYITNRWGSVIPTHYIIDQWGQVEEVNPIKKVVGATIDWYANLHAVHIELVGDFNKSKPTDNQYDALNGLISEIQKDVPNTGIKWHKDFQKKNCPWVNFDWTRVKAKSIPKVGVWDTIQFDQITAYYTPMLNDSSFSQWNFEASKAMNGDSVNAMGRDYKDDHKYTHGACWPKWKFGTILSIEWWWEVTCVDRWSAVDNTDIDIWYWYGEEALKNIRWWKVHPQKAKITVKYIP